jgi:hypothetical protein
MQGSPNIVRNSIEQHVPYFYMSIGLWSIFFSLLFPLYDSLLRKYAKKFFLELNSRRQSDLVSYMVSFTHHIFIVPVGFYLCSLDFNRNPREWRLVDYAAEVGWSFPFIFGYFVGDTVMFAVQKLREGSYDYLFHHVLGMTLMYSCALAEGRVIRYIPHMFIMETSSIFFCVAYFLRLKGWKGSVVSKTLEMMFVVSFFILRNVHMPLIVWFAIDERDKYAAIMLQLSVIVLLQFFWFYKIVLTMLKNDDIDSVQLNKKQH